MKEHATGRVVELDTIHRFRNHWEAEASLGLRHGDPLALRTYLDFDRIRAAPLDEHLDTIATTWITAHHNGQRLAITTTSNEHVAAINRTIHEYRDWLDELGPDTVTERGRMRSGVGDVIVTRRNERHLHTTTGDSVRTPDTPNRWFDWKARRQRVLHRPVPDVTASPHLSAARSANDGCQNPPPTARSTT